MLFIRSLPLAKIENLNPAEASIGSVEPQEI